MGRHFKPSLPNETQYQTSPSTSTQPPLIMKPFILFLFLLVLISIHSFSGSATHTGTFHAPSSVVVPHHEVKATKIRAGRKLIGVTGLLLDYEPPGANPAHDPPGRKGGKG